VSIITDEGVPFTTILMSLPPWESVPCAIEHARRPVDELRPQYSDAEGLIDTKRRRRPVRPRLPADLESRRHLIPAVRQPGGIGLHDPQDIQHRLRPPLRQ
jgi:hypothetical protein